MRGKILTHERPEKAPEPVRETAPEPVREKAPEPVQETVIDDDTPPATTPAPPPPEPKKPREVHRWGVLAGMEK